jgi:predicted CXXCH cytochrome family protein
MRPLSVALLLSACGADPAVVVEATTPTCASCHPAEHAAWAASHHAQAERAVPAGRAVGLDPTRPGGLPFDRIIGVEPLWQPLLPAAGGRLQTSSLAWDVAAGGWFSIFPDARQPGDWGHWTGRGMTWNSACATCHNTGVDVGWDRATDTYRTTVAEVGVTCAACHGDAAAHAAAPTTLTPGPPSRDAATCEGCHIRWTPLRGATGPDLLDRGLPSLPGLDPGYLPDGRVQAESFEAMAFRMTAKHAAGVRCVDCHEPHTSQLVRSGDALCANCHADAPHVAHPAGPTCVDCHLPVVVQMQRDPRHDHGFPIPDPGLDLELGLPSPCVACHPADAAFAARAAAWAPPDEVRRARARAVAAARRGDADAGARLVAALASAPTPGWRAALIEALRDTDRADAALPWLTDPDPWLRFAAASALGPNHTAPLRAALADPVAAVRLQAARALEPALPPDDASMAPLRRFLEQGADHPALALELGTWWTHHGRADAALPDLQRAARLDPAAAPAWSALAVALSAAGRGGEAATALDRAVTHVPDDAHLRYLHGLALSEIGRPADAAVALERALTLDPTHGRAARALGLLRAGLGDDASAEAALRRAVALMPADGATAWALATVLARTAGPAAACAAARDAVRLDPSQADAAAFLRSCR